MKLKPSQSLEIKQEQKEVNKPPKEEFSINTLKEKPKKVKAEKPIAQPKEFKHKLSEPILGKCEDFELKVTPRFAAEVTAIIGRRGSGKTFTAGVCAENLNMMSIPFIIFDPQRANLGLAELNTLNHPVRLIESNKVKPKELAQDLKKNLRQSVIIAQNGTMEAFTEFARDFLNEYMTNTPRGIRTIMFDEVHLLAPNPTKGKRTPATEPIKRLVTTKRSDGIGAVLITQRPAEADTTIFNQADNVILHRLNGLADLKVAGNLLSTVLTSKEQIEESMVEMTQFQAGECFVISESLG